MGSTGKHFQKLDAGSGALEFGESTVWSLQLCSFRLSGWRGWVVVHFGGN